MQLRTNHCTLILLLHRNTRLLLLLVDSAKEPFQHTPILIKPNYILRKYFTRIRSYRLTPTFHCTKEIISLNPLSLRPPVSEVQEIYFQPPNSRVVFTHVTTMRQLFSSRLYLT